MPNIKISDLPPVMLPLDLPNSFFEVQITEAGLDVSRKISADDLGVGGGVISVNSGVNITIDNTDPINPIVNLDAAITGVSVNGVTLDATGVSTNFLDETGNYSVPPVGGGGVTVEDEGTPLATIADTLDFVGAGVTATGVGGTKTITIPGGGGGTPAGNDEEIQFNNSGAFGADPHLKWDGTQDSLQIDARDASAFDGAIEVSRIQEGAIALKIQSINGNTTFHDIWRSFNSGGETSWRLVDDHTAATAAELLFWEDDFGEIFIEFERVGLIRFGGHVGNEKMFLDFANEVVAIRNGATLYIEELAAANPEVANHGQLWVRDDTPNVLMFTDDAGTDHVIAFV